MTRILSPNIASQSSDNKQTAKTQNQKKLAAQWPAPTVQVHSTVLQLHSSSVLRCYSSALLSN